MRHLSVSEGPSCSLCPRGTGEVPQTAFRGAGAKFHNQMLISSVWDSLARHKGSGWHCGGHLCSSLPGIQPPFLGSGALCPPSGN